MKHLVIKREIPCDSIGINFRAEPIGITQYNAGSALIRYRISARVHFAGEGASFDMPIAEVELSAESQAWLDALKGESIYKGDSGADGLREAFTRVLVRKLYNPELPCDDPVSKGNFERWLKSG